MESLFKEVVSKIKEGAMSVESAVQWMKEAKIIDNIKLTEEQAREVFQRTGDQMDFAKFEESLKKIAEESKQGVEELQQKLQAAKPQIISLAEAGMSAINKALEDVKK